MSHFNRWGFLMSLLAAAVLGVYTYASRGPLHFSTDAMDYFRQAGNIAHGRPLYATQQPAGYPFMLACLYFFGCPMVRGVVTLNLIALTIACACSWQLLRSVFALSVGEAVCVQLVTLASRPCVGFATAAMSEVPFFAASMTALVCLERSCTRRSWGWLAAGCAFAALSIELRTAGWALSAAVLVALCRRFNLRITKRGAIIAVLVSSVPLAAVLSHSKYVCEVAYGQYAGFGSPANAAVDLIERKMKVVGEIVANYAAKDVPLIYREEFTLLGAAVCLVFAIGAWTLRKNWSPTTAYLTLYSAVIWAFPFWDDRFWLPVMPLLIAVAFFGLRAIGEMAPQAARNARPLAWCYLVAFVLLGCRYSAEYASFQDPRVDKAIALLQVQR